MNSKIIEQLGTDVSFIPLGENNPANEIDGLAFSYEQVKDIIDYIKELEKENKNKMAITKIQYQSSCPYGHKKIDFVDLEHRKYVYCYECKKKYFQEDYKLYGLD